MLLLDSNLSPVASNFDYPVHFRIEFHMFSCLAFAIASYLCRLYDGNVHLRIFIENTRITIIACFAIAIVLIANKGVCGVS